MIKVSKLIKELKRFPANAYAYSYEGEITGLVIRKTDNFKEPYGELGYIMCTDLPEKSTVTSTVIYSDKKKAKEKICTITTK